MPKNDYIRLDEQLCFSLYAASRTIIRFYRPLLDSLDLTYLQYLVLIVLWEHEKVSVKDLGELLELDSGTLTPVLKRMESAGLLSRSRDLKDERSVMIEITDKGKALKKKALALPKSVRTTTDFSADEIEALNQLVNRFSKSLSVNH